MITPDISIYHQFLAWDGSKFKTKFAFDICLAPVIPYLGCVAPEYCHDPRPLAEVAGKSRVALLAFFLPQRLSSQKMTALVNLSPGIWGREEELVGFGSVLLGRWIRHAARSRRTTLWLVFPDSHRTTQCKVLQLWKAVLLKKSSICCLVSLWSEAGPVNTNQREEEGGQEIGKGSFSL